MTVKSFLICLVITIIGYFIIDVGYHVHSRIAHELLTGMGGGLLTIVGVIIKTFEK